MSASSSVPAPLSNLGSPPSISSSNGPTSTPGAVTPNAVGLHLGMPPTLIELKDYRFLITDAPSDATTGNYVRELQKYGVDVVVRACDPSYETRPLKQAGIEVVDLPFVDGDPPPDHIIKSWLKLVRQHTAAHKERAVAVHCVAGLGRAPVLVALALIESGLEAFDAIDLIRKKRRGALNHRQMVFLDKYQPTGAAAQPCCTIF